MPAEKTKGGKRPHTIPLPAIVIPTLKELVELYGDGPLFPGRPGRKNERMDHRTISHAIRAWVTRDDAKVEAFQTRDLRRTWKSRTGEVGIDRFTRDLIQQHAKHDTGSRHYDRASYIAQMREAMDRWSSCLGIVLSGGTPPAYGEPLMKIA
jgi:integrase